MLSVELLPSCVPVSVRREDIISLLRQLNVALEKLILCQGVRCWVSHLHQSFNSGQVSTTNLYINSYTCQVGDEL